MGEGDPVSRRASRRKHLRIDCLLRIGESEPVQIRALVDTGAEVSLIRQGVLPRNFFYTSANPIRIVGPDDQRVQGGVLEVAGQIEMQAFDASDNKRIMIGFPVELKEANISEEVILSYEWLTQFKIDITPWRHGLVALVNGNRAWVPGSKREAAGANGLGMPSPSVNALARESESSSEGTEVGPKRALDFFSGSGSVRRTLQRHGFELVSLDIDPSSHSTITIDILEWDFASTYPPGYFQIITASPPCTEFSIAKSTSERDLQGALAIVQRTLRIIEYFQPPIWWMENPRYGWLSNQICVENLPYTDHDYCQYAEWGYQKPTRFWGSEHVRSLKSKCCDGRNCINLRADGQGHLERLGGNNMKSTRKDKYRIPHRLVEYLCCLAPLEGDTSPNQAQANTMRVAHLVAGPLDSFDELEEAKGEVEKLGLSNIPDLEDYGSDEDDNPQTIAELARRLLASSRSCSFVKGAVEAREPAQDPSIEAQIELIKERFAKTSLSGICPSPDDLPIRGPFGEAEIWLKPDAIPVNIAPYHISGERKAAWTTLVDKAREAGKIEPGVSAWNTPSFPVPKKRPGEYRLVQDLRPQNAATIKDGHPLPRIGDILQRQGQFKMWTVLDLVDGYHQMPLKKEHRHITCMSTPRGTMQWKVLVMGLKNGNAQFQRMMEWVLRDVDDFANPYVDDIIIGSTGNTPEEVIQNHTRHVIRVLQVLEENKLVCCPRKSHFFMTEVEFCGHILREGRRSPAPGKLLPIQKWEIPHTVTALRGFLGLTNYFAEYVPGYAEKAGPLMEKLKLNRHDGKKGSTLALRWSEAEVRAFEEVKAKLAASLELFQVDPDKPFRLRCDASDAAIGAELQQEREGKWVPVGFYSRKLAGSQKNWSTREKETYAIVAALRKWAGIIGFQPVVVTTDHKSLEDWVTEQMDTPSGPRGRRARWHETLSQFDLEVKYIPGNENVVADALSRWAYPASSAREDVSFHGSAQACEEVKK